MQNLWSEMKPNRKKLEPKIEDIKKILVCIFKYHGDVLLTSPVYTALKSALPHAEIDVMLFKDTSPLLEGHPAISSFIFFDQKMRKTSFLKRILYELLLWKRVRSTKYDLVINMTSGDRGALIAKISKAPIRIGYESSGGMKKKDSFFSTLLCQTKTPRHIVERNLDVVRALGIHPSLSERKLTFFIPEAARAKISLPFTRYIVIHPVSRTSFKNWPSSHFRELIRSLKAKGHEIVISGGPAPEEKALIDEILIPLNDPTILNLQGKLTLKELGALIEKAELLISVDSVPPHIASALQKPVLALFGPSDDYKWGPWMNPHAQVIRLDLPCKRCDDEGCGGSWISDCMNNLSPAFVLRKTEEMLSQLNQEISGAQIATFHLHRSAKTASENPLFTQ